MMAQNDPNRQRYEMWVRSYASELYRYAYRLSGRRQVAEDLLQETFTEAWRSVSKQTEVEKARGWLFQILRYRYAHFVRDGRSEARTKSLPENANEHPPDSRGSPLEGLAEKDAMQAALQALSTQIRQTFLMVYMEGQTCREVAEALQIPLGTVLSRLDQARRSLRIVLDDKRKISPQGSPTKKGSRS
jgi:RNA polymerase sigma-70 factor, ECF subfamily